MPRVSLTRAELDGYARGLRFEGGAHGPFFPIRFVRLASAGIVSSTTEKHGFAGRPPGRPRAGPVSLVAAALAGSIALAACGGETVETPVHGEPRLDSVRVKMERRVARNRREADRAESRVRMATRYARQDEGLVSFALIDGRGRMRGFEQDRQFVSASLVKAMLLAAELRRLRAGRLGMDPATASTLDSMITVSDNDAADVIYERVGDAGLTEVAEKAGMAGFEVAGHWGNARLTAADAARFFRHLDRNLVGPGAPAAKKLLNSITPEQRWGIPAVAGDRRRPFFKGGWRSTDLGELVHQAALLEGPGDDRISLAVMTDGQLSRNDAIADIEQIAAILLGQTVPRPGAAKRPGAG